MYSVFSAPINAYSYAYTHININMYTYACLRIHFDQLNGIRQLNMYTSSANQYGWRNGRLFPIKIQLKKELVINMDTVQTDVMWTLVRVWRREEREEGIKLGERKTEVGIHKKDLRKILILEQKTKKKRHLNRTTHVPRLRLHSRQGSENLHFKISNKREKKKI